MDVTTAFLNGILKEEIYISQPKGFIASGCEAQVCRLYKSLYGPKQAPHIWHELFDEFLLSQGFFKCKSDTNVYFKASHSSFILLGLYVDDLILVSYNLKYLSTHKAIFSHRFSMTDNHDVEYLLGIQVYRDHIAKTIILS